MSQTRGRFVFSASVLIIGILLLVQSYVGEKTSAPGDDVGPMFYPRILLWLWVMLSGVMSFQALRSGTPAAPVDKWKSLLCSMGLTLTFGFFLESAGFVIISLLFCFFFPYMQGYRNHKVLIVFSVLYTACIWYLFNNVLYIFLPEVHWLEGVL